MAEFVTEGIQPAGVGCIWNTAVTFVQTQFGSEVLVPSRYA